MSPNALRRQIARVLALAGLCMLAFWLAWAPAARAQNKSAVEPPPDELVLSNGDTLHGRLVRAIDGKVTFHSEILGDLTLPWSKIRSLRAHERFAVVNKSVQLPSNLHTGQIPIGELVVEDGAVTVQTESAQPLARIPVKETAFILKQETVAQVARSKDILSGWSGTATMGSAVLAATQKQFTISGGIHLARVVPTVSWLSPRNRTTLSFTGSFGKITQPGYISGGVSVPELVSKSAIYHADAERDQFVSPRFFLLAQTAFDHNYSQNLDLQQVYGGGLGWTVLKTPKQDADLKATIQYEMQQFIPNSTGATPTAPNQNLVGSTFAANYTLHLPLFTFAQQLAYLPAYNQLHHYSANESNTVTFPAYKRLSFSLGTIDSYLNGPPVSEPPTKRNSFQFTMGFTYALPARE
ncbi:MAG TPA: DUF481 domain-containing protein [Terracidiphilus sp.]|nr:DUF481 domain-containing protein [Terracidiphilus sp.]